MEDRIMETNISPTNPTYHPVTGKTIWSYVYFGSYPQSEVKDADLTPAITQANYNEHKDAWINGAKYRRICKEDAAIRNTSATMISVIFYGNLSNGA